jgi:hypothetical protein
MARSSAREAAVTRERFAGTKVVLTGAGTAGGASKGPFLLSQRAARAILETLEGRSGS